MFQNLQKQKRILNMLAGTKKVSGHRFALTRLVVLARNLVVTIPWGNLNKVCSKQTSSTGTLGSTPERTQLVVLARNRFSTKHQFKHTSLQKDQLCADTIVCVLNTTPNSKKFFLNAGRRRYAALSQHANALFSKELGTLINSSFYSLLTLGDFAISSPQQKLDIAGGCTATLPYITSKKLWSKGRLHKKQLKVRSWTAKNPIKSHKMVSYPHVSRVSREIFPPLHCHHPSHSDRSVQLFITVLTETMSGLTVCVALKGVTALSHRSETWMKKWCTWSIYGWSAYWNGDFQHLR